MDSDSKRDPRYFPIFADLEGRPCLVVGGGAVALRKTRLLLGAGALVTVTAARFHADIAGIAERPELTVIRGEFEPDMVDTHFLVIAATDDSDLNARVAAAAEQRQRLCNVVDDPRQCSFILPATVQRAPITVAVSTGGLAPVLGRRIKTDIEKLLPARIGRLAAFAGQWRAQVKLKLASLTQRRRFWERFFDGPLAALVLSGRESDAHRRMMSQLEQVDSSQDEAGHVTLLGAGPGDPGLITLRGLQVLQTAEVIIHDRLVSAQVIELARKDAQFISVGKTPGRVSPSQESINELMIHHARKGRRVCRLKGGDPFVFGRGGEEVEALAGAGIGFEVIPGITAAAACAAYSGIPLTHRDLAQRVILMTGHAAGDEDSLDWSTLARGGQTLALYMSVGKLSPIVSRLRQHGMPASTPCAVVEQGTTPNQRVIRSTIGNIAAAARRYNLAAPAMVFVGAVAGMSESLQWFTGAAANSNTVPSGGFPRTAQQGRI